MLSRSFLTLVLVASLAPADVSLAADPDSTVRLSDEALHEIMAIPAYRIPQSLLADAQGLAIVPGVLKIGFIGAIRRGNGVVMVRDAEGEWSFPQFVTLTGGSVGWQAGIQATDVILVFRTKKSINGLLTGKFTIGADASAAAGPVGRSAEASTDIQMQAEILSYSRNRGIFAGVSLEGTSIDIDQPAHAFYYGSPIGQPPAQVPRSAIQLVQDLTVFTSAGRVPPATLTPGALPPSAVPPAAMAPAAGANPAIQQDTMRRALAHNSTTLATLLDANWQQYLALPKEVFNGNQNPSVQSLQVPLERFDRAAQAPEYQALSQRPEFQATHEMLRQYSAALSASTGPQLALPPPPIVLPAQAVPTQPVPTPVVPIQPVPGQLSPGPLTPVQPLPAGS